MRPTGLSSGLAAGRVPHPGGFRRNRPVMSRGLAEVVIREMHVRPPRGPPPPPPGWRRLKTDATRCQPGGTAAGPPGHCWSEGKVVPFALEIREASAPTVPCTHASCPSISTARVHATDMCAHVHPRRTQVFRAAFFVTAQTWKQHRCPSADDQRGDTWPIPTLWVPCWLLSACPV